MANKPLIISYCTFGPYMAEAARLLTSIKRLQLDAKITVIKSQGWVHATRQKPWNIIKQRDRHPGRDLLFTDADSYIHENPWPYLDKIGPCDIAIHHLLDEILSGTIYLPAVGPRTDELLDAWARADIEQPDLGQPQRVLQRIIESGDFSVVDLEARLCWIFDRSPQIYGPQKPIIEHLQASREYRHPDKTGNLLAARKARIKELEGVNPCEPK